MADHGYKENLRRVFTINKKYISFYAFNQCCRLRDEVGFGISAFSSLNDRFLINTPDFDDYYKRIANGRLAVNRGLLRTPGQQILWSIILPLKNYYIDKKLFAKINGIDIGTVFQDKFALLKKYGLIEETDHRISLTERGAFYSDEIVHIFYERQHQSFPPEDFAAGCFNPYNQ